MSRPMMKLRKSQNKVKLGNADAKQQEIASDLKKSKVITKADNL
ncbi:MAG: hypothetical protein ACLS5K_01185 [Streptococcus salivarius]